MRRHFCAEPIKPWPLPIGPIQPVTFIPLDRKDDAAAIGCGRAGLANSERVVFDCGWDGGRGMAILGFEVVRRRGRFVTLIGFGHDGEDYATLEEAVREGFMSDGCLE